MCNRHTCSIEMEARGPPHLLMGWEHGKWGSLGPGSKPLEDKQVKCVVDWGTRLKQMGLGCSDCGVMNCLIWLALTPFVMGCRNYFIRKLTSWCSKWKHFNSLANKLSPHVLISSHLHSPNRSTLWVWFLNLYALSHLYQTIYYFLTLTQCHPEV